MSGAFDNILQRLSRQELILPECSMEGCDKSLYLRTWCRGHYEKWRRHGTPLGGLTNSEAQLRRFSDPENRKALSLAQRRAENDFRITKEGYVMLRYQYDHPLATRYGEVLEHRKALYDEIGPGIHPCHWCGRPVDWDARRGPTFLHVDHIDENKQNNCSDNLVPSCAYCNTRRGGGGLG